MARKCYPFLVIVTIYSAVNIQATRITYDTHSYGREFPDPDRLVGPNPQKCLDRSAQYQSPTGEYYFISWYSGIGDQTWLGARNYCRQMCMDLVSLETRAENTFVKNIIRKLKLKETWTSGRLCNFKGCEHNRSPHVWPLEKNGWFWAGSGVGIPPPDDPLRTDWFLEDAYFGIRQPDNGAYNFTGQTESCMAFKYKPEVNDISWHDELCDSIKSYICEESDELLERASKTLELISNSSVTLGF